MLTFARDANILHGFTFLFLFYQVPTMKLFRSSFLAFFLSAVLALAFTDAFSAVTYATSVKNARLDAVTTALGTAGKLEIGNSGMAIICATFTLNNPAAAGASAGVLTLSGFPMTVAASATCTGGAAAARLRTSANADVITGLTVGTSASDIIIDNTSINSGQNVTINASPTITHN